MHHFTLDDDTGAQILEELLSSRRLVLFNAPVFLPDCRRLESVKVCTSNDNTLSIFRRICLKFDDRARERVLTPSRIMFVLGFLFSRCDIEVHTVRIFQTDYMVT